MSDIQKIIVYIIIGLSLLNCEACESDSNSDLVFDDISIQPAESIGLIGESTGFEVLAKYTNDTTVNVTGRAVFSSSDPSVVSFNGNIARLHQQGVVTITAKVDASYVETQFVSLVSLPSELLISVANNSIPVGIQRQISAAILLENGSLIDVTEVCDWQSFESDIASFDENKSGFLTGLTTGVSIVEAKLVYGSEEFSHKLVVNIVDPVITSVVVTPSSASVSDGTIGKLTSFAYYSDGRQEDVTTDSLWSSTDSNLASVTSGGSNGGVAQAIAPGDVEIRASYGGKVGIAEINVTSSTLQSINISPKTQYIPVGTSIQYTAIGVFSDNTFQDITKIVSWGSSNASSATIDNNGVASGLSAGSTFVSASLTTVSGTTSLSITNATVSSIHITPGDVTVPLGTTGKYKAIAFYNNDTSRDITNEAAWSTTDSQVVDINVSGPDIGYANATGIGQATIMATKNSISDISLVNITEAELRSIYISPINQSLAVGTSFQYQAYAVFSDASLIDINPSVAWRTLDPNIATINRSGLLFAHNEGSTDVIAEYGLESFTVSVTVESKTATSLVISPQDATVPAGTHGQYEAFVTFSDGSQQNVTDETIWSTSNASIAQISTGTVHAGKAVAISPGTITIFAVYKNTNAMTNGAVTNATLQSMEVTQVSNSINLGLDTVFMSTGYFTDLSTIDLTELSNWSSSNSEVATIDDSGVASILNNGQTNITASYFNISSFLSLVIDEGEIHEYDNMEKASSRYDNYVEEVLSTTDKNDTVIFRDDITGKDRQLLTLNGNDVVLVGDDVQAGATINLGEGNNYLHINGDLDYANINSGSGEDILEVFVATNSSLINSGAGNDILLIHRIEDEVKIDMLDGEDYLTILDVSSSFEYDGYIDMGAGNDVLRLLDDISDTSAEYNGGDGTDTLIIKSVDLDQWNETVQFYVTGFERIELFSTTVVMP